MSYSVRENAVCALKAERLLGFDSVAEALWSVLTADDWRERWDVDSGRAAVIDRWRREAKRATTSGA